MTREMEIGAEQVRDAELADHGWRLNERKGRGRVNGADGKSARMRLLFSHQPLFLHHQYDKPCHAKIQLRCLRSSSR